MTPVRIGMAASAVLDALVAIGALVPDLPAKLGLSLTALQFEAVLLSLLVVAGSNLAWLLFVEAGTPVEP